MNRRDISTLIVLEAAEYAHTVGLNKMTWEHIQDQTSAPEKVIYAAMDREDKQGYLKWGVSLRTAWLSEKGEEKLIDLRKAATGKENSNG